MKGNIKRLNEKGFGFITPLNDDGTPREGDDIFFHANDCTNRDFKEMQEGSVVTFDMGESPKGPKATNVAVSM